MLLVFGFLAAAWMFVRAGADGATGEAVAWYFAAGAAAWLRIRLYRLPGEWPGLFRIVGCTGAPLAWALWPLVVPAALYDWWHRVTSPRRYEVLASPSCYVGSEQEAGQIAFDAAQRSGTPVAMRDWGTRRVGGTPMEVEVYPDGRLRLLN